jgi:tetratricopeptide (TPR) repeat protein
MISVAEQSARIARRLTELEASYGDTPIGRQCLALLRDFLWTQIDKCARAQNDWPFWHSNLQAVDEWLALPSLEDLGVALVRRCYIGGQYEQAVGLARSILAASLENRYAAGELSRYLGLCLEEMEDFQAALAAYRQASQLYEKADPERAAAAQYQVIRLYHRLGDTQAVRAEQEKLLAQFGDSEYAKLLRQGQLPIPASSEAGQKSLGRR